MMSCTVSAAWSRSVSPSCYTEHSQRCGAVLTGHITIVVMYRSGQLGLRCTVQSNCSDMPACLAGASVTPEHALDTCDPSCVPGAARPFFIHMVHSPLGAVGYVATLELSSRGDRARSHETCGSVGAHLDKEVRFEAAGHVVATEPTSTGRCGLKLQFTRQRVDIHTTPCLDLEVVLWVTGLQSADNSISFCLRGNKKVYLYSLPRS
jgi:hypothetical protein